MKFIYNVTNTSPDPLSGVMRINLFLLIIRGLYVWSRDHMAWWRCWGAEGSDPVMCMFQTYDSQFKTFIMLDNSLQPAGELQ